MASRLIAYDPELETFEGEHDEPRSEPRALGDIDEMALAADLLEIRNVADLDRFLARLVRTLTRGGGVELSMARRQAIRRALATTMTKALPGVRETTGGREPPRFGATLGYRLASVPGPRLGLELEGLSSEDREFETAPPS